MNGMVCSVGRLVVRMNGKIKDSHFELLIEYLLASIYARKSISDRWLVLVSWQQTWCSLCFSFANRSLSSIAAPFDPHNGFPPKMKRFVAGMNETIFCSLRSLIFHERIIVANERCHQTPAAKMKYLFVDKWFNAFPKKVSKQDTLNRKEAHENYFKKEHKKQ